jgi:AraC-like DNA-binding protein
MDMNSQVLFFLSALGGFNGLLLAGYYFLLRPKTLSNLFLGASLLMISIRIIKSVFFYFDHDLDKIFLQIGLSACFLIGPFCYFYCASRVNKLKTLWLSWPLHLGLLVTLVLAYGLLFPYQTRPDMWAGKVHLIYYQWLVYLALATYVLGEHLPKLLSAPISDQQNTTLFSVLLGNWLIWLAYFTSSYTSYIVGALSFSFVFYMSFLLAIYAYKRKRNIELPKYKDKKIAADEAQVLIAQLQDLMSEEQLYQDANLTLPMVAKRLGILTQRLSQLLNDNIHKPFPVFVNEYRIAQAQQLLTSHKAMKMEVVAESCGFNSNSTFYTAFKKVTQMTPAKYRDQFKPSPEVN